MLPASEIASLIESGLGEARDLNERIFLLDDPAEATRRVDIPGYGPCRIARCPEYMTSVDAMIAAINRHFPSNKHGYMPAEGGYSGVIFTRGEEVRGLGASPSLALASAFVKAMERP